MKKILLLNHYAGSPEMGMEFRPYYLAREWVKLGYSVRIVAGDYSHLRIKNHRARKDFEEETIDGIQYVWLRTGDYKGNGVRRALTMFRFVGKLWLKAGWIAKEWKPDVVIASSTYPLDTYAAQKIAKKAGARLIHEVHDMWPATLYEIGGMSRHHPFVMLMQMAENSFCRHADYVVSLASNAETYFIRHGLKKGRFVYIPNGIDEKEWDHPQQLSENLKEELEQFKQKGKFIVGYFGGHALSNALDILLDTAKELKCPEIQIILVGNGVEKSRLLQRKQTERISNVSFYPAIKKAAIPSLVKYFDCIYMGALPSPLYRFGICMNKMFDAMMAGKPILCAIKAENTPIEKYQAGFMADSDDPIRIARKMEEIFQMSNEQRARMGENGRNAVKNNFTYPKLAFQFALLFEENQ